jgi:hypothetical protein
MRRFGAGGVPLRIPTSSLESLDMYSIKAFFMGEGFCFVAQLDRTPQNTLPATDEEIWGGWHSTSNPYQFT